MLGSGMIPFANFLRDASPRNRKQSCSSENRGTKHLAETPASGSASLRGSKPKKFLARRRPTANNNFSKKSGRESDELGFLARNGSGEPSSLNDLDDETFEQLIGPATHLSLNRRSSRGSLYKVPSVERMRTNTSRSSSKTSSPGSPSDWASPQRRMLERGPLSPANSAARKLKHEECFTGLPVSSIDELDDDSDDLPNDLLHARSRSGSFSRLSRPPSSRRIIRQSSKERLCINERRPSFSQ
jgi:hypothetical protein